MHSFHLLYTTRIYSLIETHSILVIEIDNCYSILSRLEQKGGNLNFGHDIYASRNKNNPKNVDLSTFFDDLNLSHFSVFQHLYINHMLQFSIHV